MYCCKLLMPSNFDMRLWGHFQERPSLMGILTNSNIPLNPLVGVTYEARMLSHLKECDTYQPNQQ